jgi:hypothetical protein
MMRPMNSYASLLITHLPTLLVYIAAIVVCIALWRRTPRGAMFAIFGIGVFIVGMLVSIGSTFWLMQNRATPGSSVAQVMMIIAVLGMLLHAGGVALLVAGVFAGRPAPEISGFEVQPIAMARFNAPQPPVSSPPSSPPSPPPLPPR